MVQTLLFVSGINTLIQTLFGTRLPTVISGSYAFVIPAIAIINDSSLTRIIDDHEVSSHQVATRFIPFVLHLFNCFSLGCTQRFLQTMKAIQGASIVSSCIQIVLGYSQLWGICSRYTEVLDNLLLHLACLFGSTK